MSPISADRHSARDGRDRYCRAPSGIPALAAREYDHRYMGDCSKLLGAGPATTANNVQRLSVHPGLVIIHPRIFHLAVYVYNTTHCILS